MTHYTWPRTARSRDVLCPGCRAWFPRPAGTRRKYCSDRCKKICESTAAARKRQETKTHASS